MAQNKLGRILLREKNHQAAKARFERAAQLVPDKAPVQIGLGRALAALGEHRKAIAAFKAALRLNPRLPSVALAMSDSHVALGEFEEALRVLHDPARRSRRSAVVHRRIGDIYVAMGRFVQAIEEYRAAVLNQPDGREIDPELRALLESGGNPEPIAKQIKEKLAAMAQARRSEEGGQPLRERRRARFAGHQAH
jgi:tetratricopeptide (TPR) repeat protein